MGLARHQKKKAGKLKKVKSKIKPSKEVRARSYMTDVMLCRLSQKTCDIALNAEFLSNSEMEAIRRLYARNILSPDQYLAVLEHAETWLEDTAENLFKDNPKQWERYYNRAAFLYKARKFFADYFGIEETANIYAVHSSNYSGKPRP